MKSPRRGQIFRLRADDVGKPRPILIVSPVQLNGGLYVSGVPFYSQQLEKKRGPENVLFSAGEFGLDKDCVATTSQVSRYKISELRMTDGFVGTVDDDRMKKIDEALRYSLGLS